MKEQSVAIDALGEALIAFCFPPQEGGI